MDTCARYRSCLCHIVRLAGNLVHECSAARGHAWPDCYSVPMGTDVYYVLWSLMKACRIINKPARQIANIKWYRVHYLCSGLSNPPRLVPVTRITLCLPGVERQKRKRKEKFSPKHTIDFISNFILTQQEVGWGAQVKEPGGDKSHRSHYRGKLHTPNKWRGNNQTLTQKRRGTMRSCSPRGNRRMWLHHRHQTESWKSQTAEWPAWPVWSKH